MAIILLQTNGEITKKQVLDIQKYAEKVMNENVSMQWLWTSVPESNEDKIVEYTKKVINEVEEGN